LRMVSSEAAIRMIDPFVELFSVAPANMTVIAVLVIGLLGIAVYGLQHSFRSRRLVMVSIAIVTTGLLLLLGVALIMAKYFPAPYL
jgi:hypothetical protein